MSAFRERVIGLTIGKIFSKKMHVAGKMVYHEAVIFMCYYLYFFFQDIATAQSKLTEDGRRPVSPRFTTLQV